MEKVHLSIIEFLARNRAEDIAHTFFNELEKRPCFDFEETFRRKEIREAVEASELEKALQLLNGYYPKLAVVDPGVYIDILVARLVREIERDTDALEVVTTARSEIVPLIERLPQPEDRQKHLDTLNKAMSLLLRPSPAAGQVWSGDSIYVSPAALARSVEERLVELSGAKPYADTRMFDQLVHIHMWTDREATARTSRSD